MAEKIVPQLDQHGYFVGPVVADPSPLEPGIYLIPAGAVDAELPVVPPGKRAKWNGAGFDIEDVPQPDPEPTPTPEELKARAWDSIKAERDRRRFEGGVKVGAHWYLSTAIAAGEYNSLALLSAGLPDTTVLRSDWRTMNGAKVDMTPALVKSIIAAGFAQVAAIDDAAQAHRAAMESSAEPAAYDFSAGWPETYAEYAARTAAT